MAEFTQEQIEQIATAKVQAILTEVLKSYMTSDQIKEALAHHQVAGLDKFVTTEQLSQTITQIQSDVSKSIDITNTTVNKIIESMDEKIKKITEKQRSTWGDWFVFDQ